MFFNLNVINSISTFEKFPKFCLGFLISMWTNVWKNLVLNFLKNVSLSIVNNFLCDQGLIFKLFDTKCYLCYIFLIPVFQLYKFINGFLKHLPLT